MVSNYEINESKAINNKVDSIFRKEHKVKYKRKLSGKIRLYVSEKNAIKGLTGILSLYRRELH